MSRSVSALFRNRRFLSLIGNNPFRIGTPVDINHLLGIASEVAFQVDRVGSMESNIRYYRRRAAEERTAAQRAITEQARAWHAKLAQDFAARAEATAPIAVSA